MSTKPKVDELHDRPDPPRRSFIYRLTTIFVGALVGLVPLISGVVVFLDPLRRRGPAQPAGEAKQGNWIRVATVDAVPADGVPRQFPVIADVIDAWNRTPHQPIGSVYLRRLPGQQQVECLTAICPHAGCFVAVVEGGEGKRFGCPCHTSSFTFDGQRIDPQSSPSPRDMDGLEVDDAKLKATGEIWVDYKNFLPGHQEQTVKT